MKHVIAYEGKSRTALALMQEQYVPLFLPWLNWRIGIEGTLQRPPHSLAQGIEWVRGKDKSKGTDEVFAILERTAAGKKKSYRYVGHTGIHGLAWPDGNAKTGSIIGARGARGKGIGTEAKLMLLYHAFMVMGVRKLTSEVKIFNARSAGHLMKCGYRYVGTYRQHHFHEGHHINEMIFEVFREDWEPIWHAYQKSGELPQLTDAQRSELTALTG